ncbi:MAG: gliding motility lipoprotein GldH [Bacteroidales bacterium]|jgi:gliding motility-associated lipoprotein GldH|nr:gliding motility lipoprotein GldH [Bacteroidales bacterium]
MIYKVFKQFVVLLSGCILLISCSSNTIFDQQVVIPDGRWYKNEAVKFEVNIADTLTHYDFDITLRHTTDYRFSNLYIFLITRFPEGKTSRDTIEFKLADPAGKWLGNGWGSTRDNDINLKSQMRFPEPGSYQFLILQAMRTDTLKGITDVGLRLTEFVQ